MRVVNAMCGDPVDWPTLKGKRCANNQETFHQLRHFVTPMRQQPVIGHADTEALGHPGQQRTDNQNFPTPIKKRRNGAEVENDHPYCSWPANALMKAGVVYFVMHR